jgi:hypothetical protein
VTKVTVVEVDARARGDSYSELPEAWHGTYQSFRTAKSCPIILFKSLDQRNLYRRGIGWSA